METIKLCQIGTSDQIAIDAERINDGLKNYVLSYSETLSRVLGGKMKIFDLTFDSGLVCRVAVDKDYNSRKYVVRAWALDYENPVDLYERITDFKVLSGINVNNIMRYMLEAILACNTYVEALHEDEDAFTEIADTLSVEALEMSDAAEKEYCEAKRLSEKIGTYLHYTDDPDDGHEEIVNMAMEMWEHLCRIKRLREKFIDRADDMTECDCCMEDFLSCDDMLVDGFDLKYDDPADIFGSLWNEAWRCFDGTPDQTNTYNSVLYGIAA